MGPPKNRAGTLHKVPARHAVVASPNTSTTKRTGADSGRESHLAVHPNIAAALRTLLERNNLPIGSSVENHATWLLHRAGLLDQTQYRVGRYRLDYAWPDLLVALEVDGPMHQVPATAAKDVGRDAWLRSRGWLVFRVDHSVNFEEQVGRVVRLVQLMAQERGPAREASELHAAWALVIDKNRELRKRERQLRQLEVGLFEARP